MRIKEQCFKVVCSLLKLSSIKYLEYVYFNYFRNVVEFVSLVNSKANIIVTIIKTCLIKLYNKRYALNLLKHQNSN